MSRPPEQATRDRAIWLVRLVTVGGVGGALGLTWAFSALAEMFFSGRPPAPPPPPVLPLQAAPAQAAPAVIVTIVHHPYKPGQAPSGGSAPRPPAARPAPAPPPPAVVCHSTPSKPC